MGIGSVITVSPLIHVDKLEKIARTRIERDDVAVFAAVTADTRQRRQLLRLRTRLAADPGLDVYGGADRPDGTTWLIACPAGGQPAYMGDARTGQPDEDPDGDYWNAPDS